MKTFITAASTLLLTLFLLADPAAAASDQDATSNSDNARIKALEAELAALRAQLRAESGIRNEDRGRDRRHEAERRERARRMQGPGGHHGHQDDGGHTSSFEYVYELDGDLRDAPLGTIRSQLEGMPPGSEAMIVINGEQVSLEEFMEMAGHDHGHGDHHDHGHHEGHESRRAHRVMHFDLRDLTHGEMEGEVHIEISGDMDGMPGFLPDLIMRQMDGHHARPLPGGMPGPAPYVVFDHHEMHHGHQDMHHDEMHDVLYEHVVVIMEEHGMPMEMLEEVGMAMEEHGMHPMEALHMLIERLDEEGVDPRPLIDFMEEISHDDGHHEEDPFFQQGGEFVGKMELANEIGISLSDPIDVAIFGVWEARQHLEPQERLDVLGSIMGDPNIEMSVRNAAAMVVREALYELGDRERALETLHMQIRLNGSKPGQAR